MLIPHTVVVHAGANDLDSSTCLSPLQVGFSIMEFENELIDFGIERVLISQLIRRDK